MPAKRADFRSKSGANGIRTRDLLAASQTLSQLSYGPARETIADGLPHFRFGALRRG
jgi:hypothetical protein